MKEPAELLCIDDDPQSLQVRRILLETYGFNVSVAQGGKEGLRAFRRGTVDAVVLDYHMPDLDGGEVAQRMKRLRPDVPVLILSALPWLPAEAPRECIDDFVCKGEPTALLVRKLEALLAAHPRPVRKSKLLAPAALTGKLMGMAAEGMRGVFARRKRPVESVPPVEQIPA